MRMPQPETAVQQGRKDRLLSSLASELALAGGVPERYLDNMTTTRVPTCERGGRIKTYDIEGADIWRQKNLQSYECVIRL